MMQMDRPHPKHHSQQCEHYKKHQFNFEPLYQQQTSQKKAQKSTDTSETATNVKDALAAVLSMNHQMGAV